MTRPVLIVIDVQRGFITPGSAHVVPVIADLVARWQDALQPVIFTQFMNYPGSPYERLIGWRDLQDEPATEIVPELAAVLAHPNAVLMEKGVYTALTGWGRDLLEGERYTDLFLCGIDTDGCVLKTALDAFEYGYTPWVLADACASSTRQADPAETHQGALRLMARLIGAGQVITSDDALAAVQSQGAALAAALHRL